MVDEFSASFCFPSENRINKFERSFERLIVRGMRVFFVA